MSQEKEHPGMNLFWFKRCLCGVAVHIIATVCLFATQALAQKMVWHSEVKDAATWEQLSKDVDDLRTGKFVLDVKSGNIFFFDTNVFDLHVDFVMAVILERPQTGETIREFNLNYEVVKPEFILGSLTYHKNLKLWTVSFWEGDSITASDVERTLKALQEKFFVKTLTYRPESLSQIRVARELSARGVDVITNDQIFRKLEFRAFNTGAATGVLHIVPSGTPFDALDLKENEIVILQSVYPDLEPVAGIVSTNFSTPLSHVNLRATAWGIPNAVNMNAASRFAPLDGKLVRYEVTGSGMTLRAATDAETVDFQKKSLHKSQVQLPEADVHDQLLRSLTEIRRKAVTAYGSKTANLGEVASAQLDDVHIPQGFGIPFFYYAEHIKTHKLDSLINKIGSDPRLERDSAWRREALQGLRKAIVNAPMDQKHFSRIHARWMLLLGGHGVFVRSSTNAEDLGWFNGAGLYDTVPNVKKREDLEFAIKKVWASLWNEVAVVERHHAGIDHRQVYSGVLIQRGVNATAAGVLLTTDLVGHDPDTYTINAKWGLGLRVVEGGKLPEQVLYDTSNYGARIISRAGEDTMLVFNPASGVQEVPVPSGEPILTESRARVLGETVERIVPLLAFDTPLDIEWVLAGEKFWIVQVRPYISNKSNR